MSNYSIAHHHASVAQHGPVAGSLSDACYYSLAKPDSRIKNKGLASLGYSIVFVDKFECS